MENIYLCKLDLHGEWKSFSKDENLTVSDFCRDIYYKLYDLNFDSHIKISQADFDDISFAKKNLLDRLRDLMWNKQTNLREFSEFMEKFDLWCNATVKFSPTKGTVKVCNLTV